MRRLGNSGRIFVVNLTPCAMPTSFQNKYVHTYFYFNGTQTRMQPKAMISTISNIAVASLESALPTAKATTNMLAPEEIFNPTPSDTRSRSELTPSEKQALYSRKRKAKKRQREALEGDTGKRMKLSRGISGAKKEKQAALQNIVKTGKGVTVVGKDLASTKKNRKV